ncbi:MAG: hypothetical protein JWL77_1306 [Chthonomonadaceae bacterium]|nr:hypothetical protein [Chthonomonadaceae bacterium]
MSAERVVFYLQTADKTRKAEIALPRTMTAQDLIKASTKRWKMLTGTNYVVTNISLNRQLLPYEMLTEDRVRNHDILMIQPLATHGGA